MAQQGDVLLFQSLDGGNVSLTSGLVDMTSGLETAVYLSLFSPEEWSLNDIAETDAEILYSETEKILNKTANVSANYTLLEQAIETDLKWLTDDNYDDSITVDVSSDAVNRVNISLTVNEIVLNFTEDWTANGN